MYIEGLSLSLPDSNLLEKQGIEMYDDPSRFSQDCVCVCVWYVLRVHKYSHTNIYTLAQKSAFSFI